MTGQLLNETARLVNGEIAVVLAWGRAILLQVAHPLVAAGVAEHSDFGQGSLSYLRRSYHTISAMLELTYGEPAVVRRRAAAINRIHERIHGRLQDETDRFGAGTFYSATDPALLVWVHATLVESQLLSYELFVGSLSDGDKDAYCAEAAETGPLLGIPRSLVPDTATGLASYLEAMLASDEIEVTTTAQQLARALLFPPGILLRSMLAPGRLLTAGMLPAAIREAYQFSWGPTRERRFSRLVWAVKSARRGLPPSLRRWPTATVRQAPPKM